jgi:hypothetical protein
MAEVSLAAETANVIVVVGASGNDEYAEQFSQWVKRWESICTESNAISQTIGTTEGDVNDREALEKSIAAQASGETPLWIVFIGHGTAFGEVAKFNLRGPDVSAADLSGWLTPVKRRVALINCTSSSGPFLKALSGENRVVVTATQSGAEVNYARFGDFFSQAISDPHADLDHDQQVSLLEAFLTASKNTQRFYDADNRLATEHALLDDNGDGLGTAASFFNGIRATKTAKDGAKLDGRSAHQIVLLKSERESRLSPAQTEMRNELEAAIDELRSQKSKLAEDDYYESLEVILLEIANLYESELNEQPESGTDTEAEAASG